MSREKAQAVASGFPDRIVLGSDTIVLLDDSVLGKPADAAEATAMLQRLSNKTHQVLSGFSLIRRSDDTEITGLGQAEVTFRKLADQEIADYVAGGSPMDKAGSYGIQEDLGAVFIEKISGDYYTIVGLPLMQVYRALQQLSP
jgi:septum formation protein